MVALYLYTFTDCFLLHFDYSPYSHNCENLPFFVPRWRQKRSARGGARVKRWAFSVLSLTENTLKLSLPLRASDVDFVSDVHCVNDVTPDGVVGKLNFTCA